MKTGTIIYPSSSNPPTWGHGDLLKRAANKFNKIYWITPKIISKELSFTVEQRLSMMHDYINYYQLILLQVSH